MEMPLLIAKSGVRRVKWAGKLFVNGYPNFWKPSEYSSNLSNEIIGEAMLSLNAT